MNKYEKRNVSWLQNYSNCVGKKVIFIFDYQL